MRAKVLQAQLDPSRIDEAAAAVEEELIPLFVATHGAQDGYWMVDRTNGDVFVMTCWSDDAVESETASAGRERSRVSERLGLRTRAVHTFDVVGHEAREAPERQSRWARVSWVDGLSRDLDPSLRAMHEEMKDAGHLDDLRANYWLADYESGNGVGISLWANEQEVRASAEASRRMRRWFEDRAGRRIHISHEYEAMGVVNRTHVDLTGPETDPEPGELTAGADRHANLLARQATGSIR
jgi:hypothetical protein